MANSTGLTGHVVSHTHWDRAWYYPFEIFRLRLVTLVEKLLALMEKDRSYKFCFDGQTVPFEDYLQIKPQDRGRIVRLVKAGRLHVGPFYVLPDQYLVTGESLIRNCAIGIRQASALGRCQMEGATSDVFGHPAQMPQIFAGFGIPSAIFVRGLTQAQKRRGWVQRWVAPDGKSSVVMYFLPGRGYASLYYFGMDSFDPSLYPTIPVDAGEWSVELALKHIDNALAAFAAGNMNTRHLWLGNGVDHQEAQPHVPELIRAVNRRQGRVRLVHSTYEEMMNAVRRENRRLPVIKGQFALGHHDTMTSRVYLKQAYASIASRTECLAEPLLALAEVYGAGHRAFREPGHNGYTFNPGQNWASFPAYPAPELEHLWKLLLRNSPHDDLCGCSVDRTHRDMENRFERAREISEYFINDAMLVVASRMADEKAGSKLPLLVAFNPHPFAVTSRLSAKVFIEGLRRVDALSVHDGGGRPVRFAVDAARRVEKHPFDGNDFQKEALRGMDVLLSIAATLAPCSFAAFSISNDGGLIARKTGSGSARVRGSAVVVENEFQRVTIRRNGQFEVFDREIRRSFPGLGLLEDVEDCGDEYTFKRFKRLGRPVTSRGMKGRVRIVSHDAISTRVEVALQLRLPEGLSSDRRSRSKRTVSSPVRFLFDIPHYRKGGRLTVAVDNKAKDHHLFMAFASSMMAEEFEYDSKFDYDRYAVGEPVARIDSLVIVRETREDGAIGVVGECPTVVESRKDSTGATVLMSLVRCVDRVYAGIPKEFWSADEGQCLRPITRTYEWATGRYAAVRETCLAARRTINAPPMLTPVTPWAKLRYVDRQYTTLPVPQGSNFEIHGEDVHLSAWKKSDDGSGWIVRVYSLASRRQTCRIRVAVPVRGAHLCSLDELRLSGLRRDARGGVSFLVRPKEIKTVLFEFDERVLKSHLRPKTARKNECLVGGRAGDMGRLLSQAKSSPMPLPMS